LHLVDDLFEQTIMSCFQKYVRFVTDVTLVIMNLPNLPTITVT